MQERTTLVLSGVVLLLAGTAWLRGGWELALAGIAGGFQSLFLMAPLLLCAFFLAGLIQNLLTQERVTHWL